MDKPDVKTIKSSEFWTKTPFSNIFEILKNNSLSRADLSETGSVQNIHYGDILIKYGECLNVDKTKEIPFISDDNIGNKLLKISSLNNGDIIFADAAEDNTVGKCIEIISHKNIRAVSGLHTIPCRPYLKFAEGYLGYFLNSKAFHNQLLRLIQGTKISSISKNALKQTIIKYPSLPEQRKIASYFQSLDALIQAEAKKLEAIKRIKAASLQVMFPQEGETTPKVRFKGFEGEWEEAKLGDLFKERVEGDVNGDLLSVTLNKGVIKASDNGKFDNSNADKSKYKLVKPNDIAYNTMRMWQGASGCSLYEGIVSPAYTVVSPRNGVYSLFFAYLFKTKNIIKKFRINSQGLTTDTWNLKYVAFSKIEIYYPNNANEQQKIAAFFRNLDKQISLYAKRLEKLKQIKAACLDKMFV